MGFPGMLKNWCLHHICNSSYISLWIWLKILVVSTHPSSHCVFQHQGLCLLAIRKAFEEYGHLHPDCMTGFPLGGERKDRPSSSNDPPGTLHLHPGLSCCPVPAAQTRSDRMDTACKRWAATDRYIDFSRAERNLTQKLWQLWRRLCLTVLSECC